MPPVEQNSIPLSVEAIKSIRDLKTVVKARELPVVNDIEKIATDYAIQISENAYLQSGKQMVEGSIETAYALGHNVQEAKKTVEDNLTSLTEGVYTRSENAKKLVEENITSLAENAYIQSGKQMLDGSIENIYSQSENAKKLVEENITTLTENAYILSGKQLVEGSLESIYAQREQAKKLVEDNISSLAENAYLQSGKQLVEGSIENVYSQGDNAKKLVNENISFVTENVYSQGENVRKNLEAQFSTLNENARVITAKKFVEDNLSTITENPHVQSAKHMVENIQGKVVELKEVGSNLTLDTVKEKVTDAVEHLDTMAAGGLDTLTARIPALNAPTPQLIETTKEVACGYVDLATEYISSFALAQVGLKVADRSLSIAEKTTKFFKADGANKDASMLALTYSKLRQTRRALRAIKRAGERKSYLEKDPVARTGLVGSFASLFSLNTLLGLAGLKVVAENEEIVVEETDVEDTETTEDTETAEVDNQHREISDLKGDLEGYKSAEDSDYKPEDDSLVSTEEESSDEESEVAKVEEKVEEPSEVEEERDVEESIEEGEELGETSIIEEVDEAVVVKDIKAMEKAKVVTKAKADLNM